MIAPGPSTLGRRMASGAAAEAAARSSSPQGVCGPLTLMTTSRPPNAARPHSLDDLFAGRDFLVRGDRILKIKDQRVGGQRLGFRQRFGVGAGHIEDASTRASKHEHLPTVILSI